MLAYRPQNVQEYKARGAKATGLLLPWINPRVHRPMTLTEDEAREGLAILLGAIKTVDAELSA